MLVNMVIIVALYLLVMWLFDSELDLGVVWIALTIASALSYVWHNSDLARSIGVDCHLFGDLMDTRSDMSKDIDRYIRNLDLRDL